ncbi:MAG TPA: methyltransferase domain-containing protein [Pyrinomonadaceae bacterium]|nr:methyltransferase domain-containing protein [Pyrinomonadaceae bacterium]
MERIAKWGDYDSPFVRRRYDRLARVFVLFEWLFLLPRGIRRRAVGRLELKPGDRVLEVGCGTGRNLAHLVRAVGPRGHVYGVDLSEGMLREARELSARAGWSNVTLLQADATDYDLPQPVDGAIFSLSYAVIPRHREALRRAWEHVRPGGRVVIMDAKLPSGFFGKLLHPFVVWASRLTVLGNPDIRPWDELRELTDEVDCEQVQFETYYICRGRKP